MAEEENKPDQLNANANNINQRSEKKEKTPSFELCSYVFFTFQQLRTSETVGRNNISRGRSKKARESLVGSDDCVEQCKIHKILEKLSGLGTFIDDEN